LGGAYTRICTLQPLLFALVGEATEGGQQPSPARPPSSASNLLLPPHLLSPSPLFQTCLFSLFSPSNDHHLIIFLPCSLTQDVALLAFPSLLAILQRDAPNDVETAKATLETLIILCETDLIEEEGQPKVGLVSTHIYPFVLFLLPTVQARNLTSTSNEPSFPPSLLSQASSPRQRSTRSRYPPHRSLPRYSRTPPRSSFDPQRSALLRQVLHPSTPFDAASEPTGQGSGLCIDQSRRSEICNGVLGGEEGDSQEW